uniref:Pre-mRNA-splicing factor 18 n=1 Tax=Theileria annulata TaxID=5874 RepID=A0A3B0MSG8_THEAN
MDKLLSSIKKKRNELQDIPIEEIIKRLRKLRQPILYFGESHNQRNNYLISKYINKNQLQIDFFNDFTGLKEDTKHYKIYKWISMKLNEMEEEMMKKKLNLIKEGKEFEIKKNEATLVQTKKDIKPLLKLIKLNKLDEEILEKMYNIIISCDEGNYKKAYDIYMLLAIGNAAWPMGVTMVGIHERAGRSKIYTSEVAHILNDETTRKYIQMFKRLITFSQNKFLNQNN